MRVATFLQRLLPVWLVVSSSVAAGQTAGIMSDGECAPVRLDQTPAIASLPHYDMGGMSICGVPTSAVLLAEWMGRKGATRAISTPYSLVKYKLLIAGKPNQPALRQTAGNLIADNGGDVFYSIGESEFCPHDVIPDRSNGWYFSDLSSVMIEGRRTSDASLMRKGLQHYFGNPIAAKFSDAQLLAPADDIVIFFDRLFAGICADRTFRLQVTLPEYVVAYDSNYSGKQNEIRLKFQKVINENLNTGIPTGIAYCQRALKNPKVRGIDDNGLLSADCRTSDGTYLGHAGAIVGRRSVEVKSTKTPEGKIKVCQYLIRDTQGNSCEGYPDDPDAAPTNRCENGQVWIDVSRILRNTRDVFYHPLVPRKW